MKKRAQITMETLLLYGVAILVVLLAIAALVYFGVLDLGGLLPERCNIESTGIFKCEDYKVDKSTHTIELVLVNKGSKLVTLTDPGSYEFFKGDGASTCAILSYEDSTPAWVQITAAAPIDVAPGGTIKLQIDCTGGIVTEAGKKISGKINLHHKFGASGLDKDTTGDLSVTVSA